MIDPRPLTPEVELRIATLDDAPALADAQTRSREHLRRWEPARTEEWFTAAGQTERMNYQLERYKNGQVVPWVLASGDRIVGAITLSDLVPGPFRSASLGYCVSVDSIGRGLATRAVEAVAEIADTELKLHRIEASTLTGNVASQRVLERTGFQQIGMAPTYLHIDGHWQDCNLYQRILNNRDPGT
ncbi:ribosomal-protein-alanine N-acetyltransferase [Kribbella aluminosa]|uniref:Ribosomal-protein-alanine N-acetyltransferase n=1 Tax=Kribbella aluminosa TaxID=416017 RepID=A0ABS4UMU2_9ACTN|nr:GNAT family protein [Kribbella aluminosa]MBP2352956.1 ribosomal-protein-alanine N-acetyltransferase [Kribbella aluminosa]